MGYSHTRQYHSAKEGGKTQTTNACSSRNESQKHHHLEGGWLTRIKQNRDNTEGPRERDFCPVCLKCVDWAIGMARFQPCSDCSHQDNLPWEHPRPILLPQSSQLGGVPLPDYHMTKSLFEKCKSLCRLFCFFHVISISSSTVPESTWKTEKWSYLRICYLQLSQNSINSVFSTRVACFFP